MSPAKRFRQKMEAPTNEQFVESFIPNDDVPPLNVDQNQNSDESSHDDAQTSSIWKAISTPDQITAMLSNYSTSFNVVSISIVLPILETASLYNDDVSAETGSLCASALIAGMILGQLAGGALGDLIGRRRAIFLVMGLQIFASLCSSLLVLDGWGYGTVFEQLAAWRFILGIGCGGVYPLAASLSSESQGQGQGQGQSHVNQTRQTPQQNVRTLKMLAATFSTQGVGFISVPIVALTSVLICGEGRLDYVWRLILGFGSLPGIVLMYLRWKNLRGHVAEDSVEADAPQDGNLESAEDVISTASGGSMDAGESPNHLWAAIKMEEHLVLKLAGTAGTWFLFDVVFYGNTLFQPVVVKTAFGYDDANGDEYSNLVKNIRDSMILSSIALPGYFVSITLIGRRVFFKRIQTPRYIQIQGFACMAVLYLIISFTWSSLTEHHWLLVMLYGSTFFFSNYGPNTTTFMLPSITFSPECRSTLNGIAAASGKMGALVGSFFFEPISNKYGDPMVMLLCALTSIFAGIITFYCCKEPRTVGR